jgi:hypothetical protein
MDADEVLLSCDEFSLLSPVPSLALPLVPDPAMPAPASTAVDDDDGAKRVDSCNCNEEGEMASSMVEKERERGLFSSVECCPASG